MITKNKLQKKIDELNTVIDKQNHFRLAKSYCKTSHTNYSRLIEYRERPTETTFKLKKPTLRYIDEFTQLTCAPDLLLSSVFPNAKEITESFGAYNAVRKHIAKRDSAFALDNPKVELLAIGDGSTPRTAITFAFRTNWLCWSIDPNLREEWLNSHKNYRRLYISRSTAKDWFDTHRLSCPTVIVCVHSHANMSEFKFRFFNNEPQPIWIVSIPCCVPQDIDGAAPIIEYDDWGIQSEQRHVKIWRVMEV